MVDFEQLRKTKFEELKSQKLTKVNDNFYSAILEETDNFKDERVKYAYTTN